MDSGARLGRPRRHRGLFNQSHSMVSQMWEDDERRCSESGAAGYVLKNSALDNANRRSRFEERKDRQGHQRAAGRGRRPQPAPARLAVRSLLAQLRRGGRLVSRELARAAGHGGRAARPAARTPRPLHGNHPRPAGRPAAERDVRSRSMAECFLPAAEGHGRFRRLFGIARARRRWRWR